MKRFFMFFAGVAAIVAALDGHALRANAQAKATAPPPPPKLSSSASPSPTPMPAPNVNLQLPNKAKATPTPPPPKDTANRSGVTGVWELQLQRPTGTVYTHLKIDQKDNVLSGQYLDTNGKRYPVTGLIDGHNVRVVVTLPAGQTMVFTATEEQFTDMIGLLDDASNASIPFTASYRPKYKWADNLTAGPPGTGGGVQGIP